MRKQLLTKSRPAVRVSLHIQNDSADESTVRVQSCANDQPPAIIDWTTTEGSPTPLGAKWIEEVQAWNFALYSKHAEKVSLLFYAEADLVNPAFTYRFDHLRNKSARIWHCRISQDQLRGARYYAYSVNGPRSDGAPAWHCFDPDKVLLDPYAKSVYFPGSFDRAAASGPGSNAGKAPLGVLTRARGKFDWTGERRPRHRSDTIVYELHVGGFTKNPNSGVSPDRRGTYAGVIEKIPYLKELGITVVELMPIFQFDPQEGSSWGYMPLNFFSPHHEYSSPNRCEQHNEFRAMVKALHAADIEVVLDVVYNHTAEGDQRGPVYSYKGIDNSTYYMMTGQSGSPYCNYTGTGNTLRCSNSCVRKLLIDSARYWVEEMHVDGFRFDLASALVRSDDGSLNTEDPIDLAPCSDPTDIRLIAEPWDAAGAYQLGRSFPGKACLQWNGRYRDDVRRFVRGDPGMVPALMQRLYGSDDLFPDDRANAFHPYQSVNYVTSHDGFTLYDLVSYDHKHNQANGHNNTDGPDENYSWNCGWEGDDGVPAHVLELRKRQVKNFCCLLMLANGTPMFRAGDEFMQTQRGNNNPYNQDNATSWLDWDRLRANQDVFRFFRGMIAFRKAHPSLGRSRFWRADVRWYGTGSTVDMGPESRTVAIYLKGASQQDVDLYLLINAFESDSTFDILEGRPEQWQLAFDTGRHNPDDFPEPADRPRLQTLSYVVGGRSIVGLVRESA